MSSVLKIRKSINEPWIEVPAIVPNLDDYATKDYVDDAVGKIDVPDVDLSDYYTKTEIEALGHLTEAQVLALITANMPASAEEVGY